MPDNNKPIPPAREAPASTTDEVLRLLSEQPAHSNGDDLLDNPELEQLFGTLSQGLDEGLPEGAQAAVVLTLEQLVLGASVGPARETVVCRDCGSHSPAASRFCGMCGHELGKSSVVAKAAGNGADHAATLAAVPEAAGATFQPETAAVASSSKSWKLAFLMLLCFALGVVVYQQKVWRLPLWSTLGSLDKAPTAPMPKAAPIPVGTMPEPTAASTEAPSVNARPNTSPKPSPSKPMSSTTAPAVDEARSQEAPVAESSSAQSPSAVRQEEPERAPERAPIISPSTVPIELPTIVSPPTASPVLQGTRPAPASREPSAPKISDGVVPGALILKVSPDYPQAARRAGVRGSVLLQAMIGTDGSVRQVRVISGSPLLANAAMEAVQKWRYHPFLLDGKAVEGETTITINFNPQ